MQAKRAVREVAQARICGDIGTLLGAVSDVMAADERGGGEDGDPKEFVADTNDCASFSLSEVRGPPNEIVSHDRVFLRTNTSISWEKQRERL